MRSKNGDEVLKTPLDGIISPRNVNSVKDKESAGKPGSVEDNHSSVMPVAGHL